MQWVVPTLGTFLRRIAIDYVRHGYVWYRLRTIPEQKDPLAVTANVCRYYSITSHRTTRQRQRAQGYASVVVVTYRHTLALFATHGQHRFFEEDAPYNIHTVPLYYFGYSIGIKQGKPCVMVAPKRWKAIRAQAHAIALHNPAKVTAYLNNSTPFAFPGILRQQYALWKQVNQRRKKAGLPLIPPLEQREIKHHT